MVHALARRGPDGSGIHAWDTAIFGHRRLAIFDLSDRGKQPMVSEDGSVGVTFNGAIYNFRALRQELERDGWAFRSETDTEVLLHGYRHWGIERLVSRLQGMFAFGVWDDHRRTLFLVRDRLGVKPLHYAVQDNSIAFASTARALRRGGHGDGLDPQAVTDFLEWGVVPEQRSIYLGIQKLPPATIATWYEGTLSLATYWSVPAAPPRTARRFEDIVDEAESLLVEAVRRRTEADVPVGALLSGGVDSALVCWALRECGTDPNAFTYGAPGEPEDETADARETARELGIPLTVLPAESGHDDWADLAAAYPEPFACGSAIGMLRLSRVARSAVTVLLTGDGGDDAFLGYPHHRFLHTAQRLAAIVPTPLAAAGLSLGLMPPVRGPGRRARHFAGYAAGGLGAFLRARSGLRVFADASLLGPRLQGAVPTSHRIQPTPGSGRRILDDYLAHALGHQFVAEYLAKVDGATMHFGLEARSPFLDQALWELAASLPYSARLHGGELKAVLRAIARRRISARVATGRKRGFEVPVASWLGGAWASRASRLLEAPLIVSEGWVDPHGLATWRAGAPVDGLALWKLVVLECWLRHEAGRGMTDGA